MGSAEAIQGETSILPIALKYWWCLG